jgi:putative ABC transport system permease protein
MSFLEDRWKEYVPGFPFTYDFLDNVLEKNYKNEQKTGIIFRYFTILAIVIACLGLFGLASFLAEQRTKEIGVRKVLGAQVSQMVLLLTKEFTKWVLVANVFAWPLAYFFMHRWLQNFAYRSKLGLDIFILSGLAALLFSLLTVGYQCMKAAMANPVDSLRYE